MIPLDLDGLGTHWQILIDQKETSAGLLLSIRELVARFEQKYSRFLPESEINLIGRSNKTRLVISSNLAKMLHFGLILKKLTNGAFDLNIAAVLESNGYDSDYSFTKKDISTHSGDYGLSGRTLVKRGLVKLDLGALGKGYLIDLIAKFLQREGIKNFLINGGGDIYATCKANDQSWRVAVEHPVYSDQAIGVVELKNQALATSTSQKRKFGNFHHLLNSRTQRPIDDVLSVSVLAPSAIVADGIATAIFVSSSSDRPMIAGKLKAEYFVVFPDLGFQVSPGFPGPY